VANDPFAFDAYGRLVGRASMAGSPVSMIVRNPPADRLDEVLDRCGDLLTGRRLPDEIILALSQEPPHRPPSRFGARSVRTVVLPDAAEKNGLAWLVANARWQIVVFVGSDAELSRPSFLGLVESLEHADVVVGRRRRVRGRFHPIVWMLRRMFGVGVTDPLSPIVAMRREPFVGMPLEIDEPLTLFELLAKSTFAFAIYDEIEVEIDADDASSILRTLRTQWAKLGSLFRRPHFWVYSSVLDAVRVPPQATKPPRRAELASSTWRVKLPAHSLRRRLIIPTRSTSIGRTSADRRR
jgi:hypothetical protein